MFKIFKSTLFIILIYGNLIAREVVPSNSSYVPPAARTYQDKCYGFLKTATIADKEDSSLGLIKSMHGVCRANTPIENIQKTFGTGKNFVDFLETERYKSLASGQHKFDYSKCANEKEVQPYEIASKYYYMINRVKEGQENHLNQISMLDQIIGDNKISQFDCSKMDFPEVKSRCEVLSQCSAQPKKIEELVKLTERTQARVEDLNELVKERKQELAKVTARNYSKKKALNEEIAAFEIQISEEKSQIPWIAGDEYKKSLKNNPSIAEAIKKQLIVERRKAIGQFIDTQRDRRCITGQPLPRETCNPNRIAEMGERTPANSFSPSFGPKENREKDLIANKELEAQSCLFDGKVAQLNASHVIDGAFVEAGLGLATLGLASSATMVRFIAGRAWMSEKVAANVAKSANLARIGVDSGMFLKNSNEAISACSAFAGLAKSEDSHEEGACAIPSVYSVSPASIDYTNCMFALAFVAFDVTRIAGGQLLSSIKANEVLKLDEATKQKVAAFMEAYEKEKNAGTKNPAEVAASKLKNKKEVLSAAADLGKDNLARFKAAEAVIGRELSPAERRALLKAHNVASEKSYFEYSQSDLREKYEILKGAGFSAPDIRKIMRAGIAGNWDGKAKGLAAGLTEDDLVKPLKPDDLKPYYDELKPMQAKGEAALKKQMDLENWQREAESKLRKVEKQIEDASAGQDEKTKKKILAELDKEKEEIQKKLDGFARELSQASTSESFEKLSRVRGFIANKTDDIARAEEELSRLVKNGEKAFQTAGKSSGDANAQYWNAVRSKKSLIARQIKARQEAFEEEAAELLAKDPANVQHALVPLRRSVKDLNQLSSRADELEGSLNKPVVKIDDIKADFMTRALAQTSDGISVNNLAKFAKAVDIETIQNARPLLSAKDLSPAIKQTLENKSPYGEVWRAYTTLAQRKGDFAVVTKMFEQSKSDLVKRGISQKEFPGIERSYLDTVEKARGTLHEAIRKIPGIKPDKVQSILQQLDEL